MDSVAFSSLNGFSDFGALFGLFALGVPGYTKETLLRVVSLTNCAFPVASSRPYTLHV